MTKDNVEKIFRKIKSNTGIVVTPYISADGIVGVQT